jgi:hypothetical protein
MFLCGHGVLDRELVDSRGDLSHEHRPTLIPLSPPVSTIHPGDNARAVRGCIAALPAGTE